MSFTVESILIVHRSTELILLSDKALYLQKESTLVVSDMHLGKTEHFRKNGIGIPDGSTEETLQRFGHLLDSLKPIKVVLLGDLFHSDYNLAWDKFHDFLMRYPDIEFHLIIGNHDVLDKKLYEDTKLSYSLFVETKDLLFSHDKWEEVPEGKLNVYGHVHPAVRLRVPPRQSVKLPCFCLTKTEMIMPAFGSFTGNFIVEANNFTDIFVVYGKKIRSIKTG
jgi:DNA ligase-associated metallophosphoesterase